MSYNLVLRSMIDGRRWLTGSQLVCDQAPRTSAPRIEVFCVLGRNSNEDDENKTMLNTNREQPCMRKSL